jgi:hypothetical protein
MPCYLSGWKPGNHIFQNPFQAGIQPDSTYEGLIKTWKTKDKYQSVSPAAAAGASKSSCPPPTTPRFTVSLLLLQAAGSSGGFLSRF